MLEIGGILTLLGFWGERVQQTISSEIANQTNYLTLLGTFIVTIVSLIGGWLLTGGLEWCKKEWRFYKSASLMVGPPALPIIGNALHFACKGDGNPKNWIRSNWKIYRWSSSHIFRVVEQNRWVGSTLRRPISFLDGTEAFCGNEKSAWSWSEWIEW